MNNNITSNHQINQINQDTLEVYAIAYGIEEICNHTLEYENEIACTYDYSQNTLQDIQYSIIL